MRLFIVVAFLVACTVASQAQSLTRAQRDSIVNVGVMLHDRGEFEKAIDVYQTILDQDPDDVMALYEIAYSYSAMNIPMKSIEYAERAVPNAEEPLKTHLRMMIANNLDAAGESDKALDVYRTIIEVQPNVPLVYFNMAVTYLVKGQTDSSLKMVERSIVLDPGHPGSRYVCMRNHIEKQNQVPALVMGAIMLALDPTGKRGAEVIQTMDQVALVSSQRRVDSSGQVGMNVNVRSKTDADSIWNVS